MKAALWIIVLIVVAGGGFYIYQRSQTSQNSYSQQTQGTNDTNGNNTPIPINPYSPTPTPEQSPTPAPVPITTPAPVPTPTPAASPTTQAISISNFAFSPASVTVKSGTKVTWKNNDGAPHTVTSDSNAFGSDTLNTGATFSFTFATPGTYTYHCAIHPSMKGTIIVQ